MHSFVKHGTTYTVVDKVDDYTIIHREVNFQPWIVAYGFDMESNSWAQSHYCDTLENAVYTAKRGNLWSKDLNFKNEEVYLIAIKRETDGRLGMSPEEWVETHEAEYIASSNKFYYYDEYEDYYISETEILGAIPIADPDDLLD